ncbi:MAG TPA: O-antigen ligase family protein, partial [Candidatus Saccharimonadales bacterium]|nr:O-antigen ligase family protein [Candidatus Saccharimonadales bacterium]
LRQRFLRSRLIQLILLYTLVQLVWGFVAYGMHHVTPKAMGYGLIVNLRLPAFFAVTWVLAQKSHTLPKRWRPLVYGPAIAVIVIGLLQYFVLPYDFLRHFGYGPDTINPYETINHNVHYIRAMSTLRGANPLGAYLVLILSLLFVEWRRQWRDWQFAILPVAGLIVLVLSFSRAAWVGLLLAGAVVGSTMLKTRTAQRTTALVLTALVVIAAGLFAGFRHNTTFQNVFAHTQDHSLVATTSNGGHTSALRSGAHDVLHEPLGRGVGTAGPASIYNDNKGRIAENYFIQIGQETGWIGLLLFISICVVLGRELWLRRQDDLALGLLAALVGLSFVNLLSHAWADDTLAYVFWGLAGIALAKPIVKTKTETKHAK